MSLECVQHVGNKEGGWGTNVNLESVWLVVISG